MHKFIEIALNIKRFKALLLPPLTGIAQRFQSEGGETKFNRSLIEVGAVLRDDRGWATVPDGSLQLTRGGHDIGQGDEGEPVHAPEVDPQG